MNLSGRLASNKIKISWKVTTEALNPSSPSLNGGIKSLQLWSGVTALSEQFLTSREKIILENSIHFL
jgi:hypothetical protein